MLFFAVSLVCAVAAAGMGHYLGEQNTSAARCSFATSPPNGLVLDKQSVSYESFLN